MLQRNQKACRLAAWLCTAALWVACGGCQNEATPRGGAISNGQADQSTTEARATESAEDRPLPAGEYKVSIDNFTFHPEALEVPAGTNVVWTNTDDVPHTVRSTDDLFRSGALDTDDVYEHVFAEPGTYEYYCGVHRHMTGKIVVK